MSYTLEKFCQVLFNDEKITFRAIKEDGTTGPAVPLYSHIDKTFIDYHNGRGCGVFFMPNTSGSTATKDENITTFNAVFIDIDDDTLPDYMPVKPSAIVSRTDGRGHHIYWFINPTNDGATWKTAQQILINFFQSDPSIKNPARLMRVPGTRNNKTKYTTAQVYEIKTLNANRYDLSDIIIGHTDKAHILKQVRITEKTIFPGMTDKGAIHSALVKIVNRLHGMGFDEDGIFQELQHINEKFFEGAYSDDTLKQKVTARKYAKSKKGAELIEEIEKELARQEKIREALIDWYYIVNGNYFINITSLQVERNKEGFNAAFAHMSGLTNLSSYIFLHRLIKMAEGITYEPGQETVIYKNSGDLPFLNIWTDDRCAPDDTDCQWFIDHINYLMTPAECDHFLNWLAFAVQNPGVKIRHAVLIIGGFGVGKSIMFELFKKLFGPSNAHAPQNENLSDKYTKWAKHTCFTLINELKQDGNFHFYNAIKPFITEDDIEIREMYKDPYTIRNTMNILAFSNEEVPIRLEQGDRRWYVIRSNAVKKEGDYYIKFLENCDKCAGGVMRFLLDRDLSAFNPGEHPGNTEAKQFIVDQSKSDLEVWLSDQIQGKSGIFENDIISVRDIFSMLPDNLKYSKFVSARNMGRLIRKYGGVMYDTPLKIGDEVKTYFIMRNHDKYVKLTPDIMTTTLNAMYKQEKGFSDCIDFN